MKYINIILIILLASEGYIINLKNRLYMNYLNAEIACFEKADYKETNGKIFKSDRGFNDGKDGFPKGPWTSGYCHESLDLSRAFYNWSHLEQINALVGYDKENNTIFYAWKRIEYLRTMWDKK